MKHAFYWSLPKTLTSLKPEIADALHMIDPTVAFAEYPCVTDECGHLFRPQLTHSEHAGSHEAVLSA